MPGFEPINRPVRKNANGGFDILLGKALTGDAITGPALSRDAAAPPDMAGTADLEEDRATREPGGPGGGWVDDVMQTTGTNDSRAQYTPPSMPPDMGGNGLLSKLMPGGMGDTLSAVAGGMNTIERTQTPLAGFAAGFSGAMSARDTRRKDKRAEMLQDEDRQLRRQELEYQHSRDEFRDRFLVGQERRAETAAELDARRLKMDEASTALSVKAKDLEIKKAEIELTRYANQHGLDTKTAVDLYQSTVASVSKQFEGADMADPKVAKSFRQTITDTYMQGLQSVGATGSAGTTPATGPDGLPVATASAPASAGDGKTAATALKWTSATAPKTDADFLAAAEAAVAANGGNPIYIVNPGNPAAGPQLYVSKRAG